LCADSIADFGIPAGHPAGYLEAFENICCNFVTYLYVTFTGVKLDPSLLGLPMN
jgi:hypothetical protein